MKKKYRRLTDTAKNEEERAEFDKYFEKYKEMFKKDFIFIGIIGRKLLGNDKKKRYRFGDYIADKTLLELYEESKVNKTTEFLK